MNRFLTVMFCIGLTFNTNRISAQKNNSLRVILDPGHGGEDSGAIGVNGIYEKDIVIQVAREVIRLN
ncbi:MAG: N-acetylmuramoyl-L-alanine amidase, partial [Arenibacter latericius]|nr:N-acetylmuramoyl-L-alanine amidase [Arenibacter latericius]